MNKSEFISFIAEQNKCTKADAERAVNMFAEGLLAAAKKKKEVVLIGLMSLKFIDKAAREGRNPQTGAPMKIKAYTQPQIKAGKALKDACN